MPAIIATENAPPARASLYPGRGAAWGAAIAVVSALLAWPALYNGYPLVFADTGTYLSQAAIGYVGWDRPPIYSVLVLPLHLTRATWPIVAAQTLAAAALLAMVARAMGAGPARLTVVGALLAVASPLPWFAAQIMPDVLTGLLVLSLVLLLGGRFGPWVGGALAAAATAMLASHLSHLPLALALLAVLAPIARPRPAALLRAGAMPLAALALWVTVNDFAHGRPRPAPFGDTFVLARLIEDGPAMDVLRRDCALEKWRLCRHLDELPVPADTLLWHPDSPLNAEGGAKALADESAAIVARTIRAAPGAVLRAAAANTLAQLDRFSPGDGLRAWPATVTPWVARLFPPSELAAYAASRQARGMLDVPPTLVAAATVGAAIGIVGCVFMLATDRRRMPRLFALAALSTLGVNAAVTGALSGPHDRYQARVMWLPLAVAALAAPPVRPRWSLATAGAPA